MKRLFHLGTALLVTLAGTAKAQAQARPLPSGEVQKIYDRLLKQIDRIPIYDHHSHATFPDDSDMDAMASPPEESTVMRLRDSNPEFVAAAKALFGYSYDDFKPEHAKWLIDKKKAAEAAGGTAYWDSILDKMNIETCLANRVALAPYLDPKRFHWVFFVDSFLFPFDNHNLIAKNGDMAVYIPLQERVLQRYMKQENVNGLPANLAGYEAFIRQMLADNQKKGGVASKFEAAYFRSLYFRDPPREKAEAVYGQFRAGGAPSEEDYLTFQDYVFRVLIDQAGKLKLPVHFHSAVGIGDYFSLRNGNPLNLENVLRDPRYSNVKFVLIHGGYPYTLDMIWLTAAKNVYREQLNPLIDREMVVGDKVMLARVLMKKGGHVPLHHHHNEQVTYILEGALKFAIDGKEIVVRAGEVLCIPPHMPHEAWAVEDTVDLDVFDPPREDWLNKTDDYLRHGR